MISLLPIQFCSNFLGSYLQNPRLWTYKYLFQFLFRVFVNQRKLQKPQIKRYLILNNWIILLQLQIIQKEMGNNFCSTCKAKQGEVPLTLFTCNHHTCIHCIKNNPAFSLQYKLIQCQNCKKKSLVNDQGGCQSIVLDSELIKFKRMENPTTNQNDYYQWLRAQKIQILQAQISAATTQKNSECEKFEKAVMAEDLIKTNQTMLHYMTAIRKVKEQKIKCYAFRLQYPLNKVKSSNQQSNNQVFECIICFDNKSQYCINTCRHVCLCQKHQSVSKCPVCQSQGKVVKNQLSK